MSTWQASLITADYKMRWAPSVVMGLPGNLNSLMLRLTDNSFAIDFAPVRVMLHP